MLAIARIVVDPVGTRREISPLVFGLGLEWVENGNRLLDPASGRLRDEVVARLKPLRVPVWRFPGGILADHYHWRDGVGPRRSRPVGANPMDGSSHANVFGTDEFIELCRALGSEGLVTLNFGNGTLEEALAWQKHFLTRGFPVRYWEVGNEILPGRAQDQGVDTWKRPADLPHRPGVRAGVPSLVRGSPGARPVLPGRRHRGHLEHQSRERRVVEDPRTRVPGRSRLRRPARRVRSPHRDPL